MNMKLAVALAVTVTFAAGARVLAHHSFAAQYDQSKPIEVKGTVTKVEWTNPHARFYIDAKNDKGEVTSWNFELASPNVLVRNGWKRTTLKIGEEVTAAGYLARTGPPAGPRMAIAGAVTGADGKKLFASATADLPPGR